MSQCIVITSGKGGVGKTTISTNLGICLAQLGKRVVLVDTDIGLRNLDLIMGLEDQIRYDLVQVAEGVCPLEEALVASPLLPNLYILAASQHCDKTAISTYDMRQIVGNLQDIFDYVIVDCPAGIEQGFRNAIAGADQAFIVVTPDVSSIRDADRVISLLEREGHELKPQLIINRYRSDLVERGEMLDTDDIWQLLGIPLIGVLPESEDVLIASNRGEPVVLHSHKEITEVFQRISHRVEGETVPFLSLERPHGLWDKIKEIVGYSKHQKRSAVL